MQTSPFFIGEGVIYVTCLGIGAFLELIFNTFIGSMKYLQLLMSVLIGRWSVIVGLGLENQNFIGKLNLEYFFLNTFWNLNLIYST